MFTGIIEHLGKVASLTASRDGGRLAIDLAAAPEIAKEMKQGDSIAVNGCCLTVVEHDKRHFSADLSGETLRRTSLGEKKTGRSRESRTPAHRRRAPRGAFRTRPCRWSGSRDIAYARGGELVALDRSAGESASLCRRERLNLHRGHQSHSRAVA